MLKKLEDVISRLFNQISVYSDDKTDKKIFLLNGIFGSGKTFLLNKLTQKLIDEHAVDAVLNIDCSNGHRFLTDILDSSRLITYSKEDTEIAVSETRYNKQRFDELIEIIHDADTILESKYYKINHLPLLPKSSRFSSAYLPVSEAVRTEESVRALIEKKGDKRLLLQTSEVTTESLIVDFMNSLYSGFSVDTHDGNFIKKKVLIVADNYEHIAAGMNQWLSEFCIPYCFEKRFSDFISYDISHVDSRSYISDFFDFKFIISSREQHIIEDYSSFVKYSSMIDEILLQPQTSIDIAEELAEQGVTDADELESALNLSKGLPFLLELWLEARAIGFHPHDAQSLVHIAAERILRNTNEEERIWQRCAAFLDEITPRGLMCFPQIHTEANRAFALMIARYSSTEKNRTKNSVGMNPIVREYLIRDIKVESHTLAEAFEGIAATYSAVRHNFSDLKPDELDFLREIAYFNEFSIMSMCKKLFKENSEPALAFIEAHKEYFVVKKVINKDKSNSETDSFVVKDEYRNLLINFNKLIDKDSFSDKVSFARSLENSHLEEMRRELSEKERNTAYLEEDIKWMQKKLNSKQLTLEHIQSELIEIENNILSLRQQLHSQAKNSMRIIAYSVTALTLIFIILSVNSNSIFASSSSTVSLILQGVLYFLSIAGFIASPILLYKAIYNKSGKRNVQLLKELLQKSEEDKRRIHEEMNTLHSDLGEIDFKIKSNNEQISQNRDSISVLSKNFMTKSD